jgi:hypothetical protein
MQLNGTAEDTTLLLHLRALWRQKREEEEEVTLIISRFRGLVKEAAHGRLHR